MNNFIDSKDNEFKEIRGYDGAIYVCVINSEQIPNPEASVRKINVNASEAVVLSPANPKRKFLFIDNGNGNRDIWIRLQPADISNDKIGMLLKKGTRRPNTFRLEGINIYTGEVSAISQSGSGSLMVTEY